MKIYQLVVSESFGKVVAYFEHWADAAKTYETTYAKVATKPRYAINDIEVQTKPTHL